MKTFALVSAAALVASAGFASPIVQVRDLPNAPAIDIVAWDADHAEYGFRTRLRRDGSHLGEGRVGDHRLFISSSFVSANGAFSHAVTHTGKLLRVTNTVRDVDACRFGGGVCSPAQTIGLSVADKFLRENRDSLVVTLRPQTGRNWSIRLDRALIDAYLSAMDSVSAALKKQ